MTLDGILPFARNLLGKAASNGDIAVDATMGNGHDTLFLANLVGSTGMVYAFDVQPDAVLNTKKRLEEHSLLDRAALFHKGHEQLHSCIPKGHHGKISAAIFNLGYLPGSDKTVVTKPDTTIEAISQLLPIMAQGGLIVLVIYHGHEKGKIERDHLLNYVAQLDQKDVHVLKYQFINQKNSPPFIIAIEKR
mgnify:CR=1 FL=1